MSKVKYDFFPSDLRKIRAKHGEVYTSSTANSIEIKDI